MYLFHLKSSGRLLGDVALHAGHQHGGAEELVEQRSRLGVLAAIAFVHHWDTRRTQVTQRLYTLKAGPFMDFYGLTTFITKHF